MPSSKLAGVFLVQPLAADNVGHRCWTDMQGRCGLASIPQLVLCVFVWCFVSGVVLQRKFIAMFFSVGTLEEQWHGLCCSRAWP